ncbi:MAG: type II secretion system protein M [Tatlockia sp.]|nr:type II secretion system protein M [Tatlockia sp.]
MILNYWSNLNERERWLLGIGTVSVVIYLFYLVIYSPLANAVEDKSRLLVEQQNTLQWLHQARMQHQNQSKALVISNPKLLALIGNQLNDKSFKPFPYQLQQTGPGDIQLSFERVPYKQFLSWLWNLNQNYLFNLKQFSAERTETSGVVKAFVIISAK